MNNVSDIIKQLQEMIEKNPGLTIYLNEEELIVMIKIPDSKSVNNFKNRKISGAQY